MVFIANNKGKNMENLEKKKRKPRFNQRDRRREFIKAAEKIFAQKGFEQTTIRDIATEAKASTGLLFSYFKNKESLVMEIVQERKEESLLATQKVLSQQKPFQDILIDFYMLQLEKHSKFHESQKILLSNAIKDPLIAKQWFEILMERMIEPISVFIQKCIESRELPKSIDISATANLVLANSYYIGFIRRFILGIDEKTCKKELKLAACILAKGLMSSK